MIVLLILLSLTALALYFHIYPENPTKQRQPRNRDGRYSARTAQPIAQRQTVWINDLRISSGLDRGY